MCCIHRIFITHFILWHSSRTVLWLEKGSFGYCGTKGISVIWVFVFVVSTMDIFIVITCIIIIIIIIVIAYVTNLPQYLFIYYPIKTDKSVLIIYIFFIVWKLAQQFSSGIFHFGTLVKVTDLHRWSIQSVGSIFLHSYMSCNVFN